MSYKVAEVLLSAGLSDEAGIWLKKGLQIKQPYFDRLMYDPKTYFRRILRQIEQLHKQKSSFNPPGK